MTDHELYMHILENYKPKIGTAIFFDLRNYHLCGLQPRILHSAEELSSNWFEVEEADLYAFMDNTSGEPRLLFTYKEFFVFEIMINQYRHDFDLKIEVDITPFREQAEKDLENMIEALKTLKKAQGS